MINCVGLQNPGVDYFLKEHLPWLKTVDTKIIANVAGSTIEDYIKMCEKVSVDGVDMVELNISCPNVKAGGASLGVDPKNVEEVTRAVRDVCKTVTRGAGFPAFSSKVIPFVEMPPKTDKS